MKNPDLKDAHGLFRCAGARGCAHAPEINMLVFQRTVQSNLIF